MNRKEAQALGLPRYFTGNPCKHGHVSDRQTSNGSCIACNKKCQKAWRADHPEKVAAQKKAWCSHNPEKVAAYKKAWRDENPSYQKEYSESNREKIAAKKKEYQKSNPELRRSYQHKRRAKVKKGETTSLIVAWTKDQKKICYYCNQKCPKNYHIDHYIPLSKGGLHEINNLRIACARCNLTKNAKDPYEFAKENGKLF